ncbi:MAG: PEP-CTERM system histidine kinase PrsK [Sphingomonadales bacterium]|nr:PEP-CTERM system histidine kinase PrsK [Sphingomonadales bacterium]MDE2169067.1 PEP-CTERM system histidine kinase PrsK [Sphingomonadales bacterium]
MNPQAPDTLWAATASSTHAAGACAAVTVAVMLWGQRDRFGQAGAAIIAALACEALWCLSSAVEGAQSLTTVALLALRNLTWLAVLYRLFASDGRHTSVRQVRPVLIALAAVDLLAPMLLLVESRVGTGLPQEPVVARFNVMLPMLAVVGSLVLVHNLFVGADQAARAMLRWPAMALGAVWVFELNLYTVAYLDSAWPDQLSALHGLVDVGFAVLMAVGAMRGRDAWRLRPSRAMTFHSVSLLVIGGYFVAMIAVAQWLAYAGGDYARWLQFSFVILATAGALVTLPSRRLRAWLRVTFVKHLFQHRYDYRAEWLRFTQTISRQTQEAPPLNERAIQAVADITDSPAGLLLLPDDLGDMMLAARWRWPAALVSHPALSPEAVAFFEAHDFIIDLDDLRERDAASGAGQMGEAGIVPGWLHEEPQAWALVPLRHFDRMVGAIVLARPPQARKLDWEDFDLLRVVGQQLATYLAEHHSQQALAEASRFDDFHRRIAFVMHDIKNLSSQLTLLARNAQRHAENPDFRADMLVTLRNSADKLNHLVARLSRYGGQVEKVAPVPLGTIARDVAAQFAARHRVDVIERDACVVSGNAHSIEQVLVHLVQNAVDASAREAPVFLSIARDEASARIEVVDAGIGMSADFLRTRLFRPFVSTKPGGFGIGAYEARELVRAMQGRIDVESQEGIGTRFIVRLPLAQAESAAQAQDVA